MKPHIAFGLYLLCALMLLAYLAALLIAQADTALVLALLIVGVLLIVGLHTLRPAPSGGDHDLSFDLAAIACCVAGGVLTLALRDAFSVTPVLAAALVGSLSSGLLSSVRRGKFSALALPTYCGCFVGMTAAASVSPFLAITAASALAGLLYTVLHLILPGVGGKLGMIALISVSVVYALH